MPSRHSKNAGDRHHFTYHEKVRAGHGTIRQRLGTESQLPFGYCGLSMTPAEDPVVSPSGHIYSRESIIEYLLNKSKELKKAWKQYEDQQSRVREEQEQQLQQNRDNHIEEFKAANEAVKLGKRETGSQFEGDYGKKRRKLIDDTDRSVMLEELKHISPWAPQFTPNAQQQSAVSEPPKRPASPFSGRPLRSKDLIAITLPRENNAESSSTSSGTVRFICPVSRKTITTQKVFLIKTTGALMIEQTAKDLAFPSMTCPMTSSPFTMDDVLELVPAASGFSASGSVEAEVHRPTIN